MRNLTVIILFLLPFVAKTSENTKVHFYKGDILKVKAKARAEGKLYVYDFVASWCTPCKIMDESTFNDEILADYIAENYIFAKVNIDDFDGMNLKEQYQIQYLPTILVFNQAGEIVAKQESSIGSRKLLELLKNCNTEANGAGKKYVPKMIPQEKPSNIVVENAIANPPSLTGITSEMSEKSVKKAILKAETLVKREKSAILNISSNIYHLTISSYSYNGFSIQTCALTQYDNVIKYYNTMKENYPNQPILMLVETQNDRPMYKILVGQFKQREEAELFKKNNGLEGYVKYLRH